MGDEPVVMAVRRETRGSDGALLDVVDAIYDARRYSYQAEIRRDVALPTEKLPPPEDNGERLCVEFEC